MASANYNDSEESNDEDFEMTMKSVLPVANFDDYDLNVPPQSGAEYLRRVQLEAKKEPKFKVATNLTQILKSPVPVSHFTEELDSDEFIPAKPEFRLSQSAISSLIEFFIFLRGELDKLRRQYNDQTIDLKRSKKWWRDFCLAPKEENGNNTSMRRYQPQLSYSTNLPRLTFLSQLEQTQVHLLLKYHCQWIEEEFTVGNGLWIYSLLSALDTTQTGDVYSLLREICRLSSRIRHRIEINFDTENREQIQQISSLNLIIVLIGHYFGQKDLLDS